VSLLTNDTCSIDSISHSNISYTHADSIHQLYFTLITVNPLNADLNPICHLLALLGGATIVDISRLWVKYFCKLHTLRKCAVHTASWRSWHSRSLAAVLLRFLHHVVVKRSNILEKQQNLTITIRCRNLKDLSVHSICL
jgi:hypothetical protein